MINFDWKILLDAVMKMLLALVCGGILGLERGRKKRPAGFRTYMLVCLGATLVMMTNEYICIKYNSGDVARMGAQVISGIGFLGAGTIITTGHNRVKGLTTAAGLWAAACVGLAIGSGYFVGAVLGTTMIAMIMIVFHSFDRRFLTSTKVVILYVEFKKMAVIRRLATFAREHQIAIDEVDMEPAAYTVKEKLAALVTLRLPIKKQHEELIEMIDGIEGITYVEEIM